MVEINPEMSEIRQQLAKMMEQMERLEKQIHTGEAAWKNRTKSHRKGPRCYNCQEFGHIKVNCPELVEKEAKEKGQGSEQTREAGKIRKNQGNF